MVKHIVFIQPPSQQNAPPVIFPLILQKNAVNTGSLGQITSIPLNPVGQLVIIKLRPQRQIRRHKHQTVEMIKKLPAPHIGQIGSIPVGIRIPFHPVITFPVNVLHRRKQTETGPLIGGKIIKLHSTRINIMFHLFGNIRFVGRKVHRIAPAAELMNRMIFHHQTTIRTGFQKRPHPGSLAFQLGQLAVPVTVMVIFGAETRLGKNINPAFMVIAHQRSIQRGRMIKNGLSSNHIRHVSHLCGITLRLFGNHIYRSGYCRRTEQCTASSSHHFHPFNHIRRNLFQPIYPAQRTEHRTRINQYLRIRPIQTVNPHLLESAILAIVLHPNSRLEAQSFRQTGCACSFKQFRIQHFHNGRCLPAGRLITVCRHHHFIQRHLILFHFKIEFQGKPFFQHHFPLLPFIADSRHHHRKLSLRQIPQEIVSRSVRRRSDGRPFQSYCHKRQMLAGMLIHHMTVYIRIRRIQTLRHCSAHHCFYYQQQ